MADCWSDEQQAIASWLQHIITFSRTGQPLQHVRLVSNVQLRQAVEMVLAGLVQRV